MSYIEKLLNGAEVQWKTLGEVTDIKTGQSVSKNMINENPGEYPVINSGKEPLGFINIWNTNDDPIGITSRGAGVGSITWQDGKYFRGNLNYSVTIIDDEILKIRYLYHILLEMQSEIHSLCTFQGIPALNAGNFKNLQIPIPPLSVQKEIVRILDKFTELTTELTAELTLRKKQYAYYREKLLTFQPQMNTDKHGFKVEWKALWEVTIWDKKFNSVDRKKQPVIKSYPYLLASELFSLEQADGDIFLLSTGERTGWTSFEMAGSYLCEGEVVAIPWGKSRPVKEVMKYYNGLFVTADNRIATSLDTNILSNKYLYYWLMTQSNTIDSFYRGSGIQHPNMAAVLDLQIAIPPLAEQERIVSILDKFDTLTTSISEGLPKEIELRRKQYEYYREQLLTFNKPKTNTRKLQKKQ